MKKSMIILVSMKRKSVKTFKQSKLLLMILYIYYILKTKKWIYTNIYIYLTCQIENIFYRF